MATLVFGMNVSLDGYVDHTEMRPDPVLFEHWIDYERTTAGSIYGRRMYEVMRYWDEDDAGWDAPERAFAAAWRAQPKWVASRTLKSVGPNATLIGDDLKGTIRDLKTRFDGELSVSGPEIAHVVGALGLIDEYRLYLHPAVLGRGKPFFAGARPPLRFKASERIGADVVRLSYVPV